MADFLGKDDKGAGVIGDSTCSPTSLSPLDPALNPRAFFSNRPKMDKQRSPVWLVLCDRYGARKAAR